MRSLINARENDEYYECTREKANTIRDKDRVTRNAEKGDDKRIKKTTGMQIARVRSEKNDFAGKKPTLSSVRCFPWEFRRRGEGRNLSCSSGVCNSLGEKRKKEGLLAVRPRDKSRFLLERFVRNERAWLAHSARQRERRKNCRR